MPLCSIVHSTRVFLLQSETSPICLRFNGWIHLSYKYFHCTSMSCVSNTVLNRLDSCLRHTLRQLRNHWMLLVISPQKNTVYFLGSAAVFKRDIDIKPILNMAFKTYWACGDFRTKSNTWKNVKCPQQLGG